MARSLASRIAPEISGYLTEKVPPKPQHASLSASSTRVEARRRSEQPPRRLAHMHLAQGRAGIVIGDASRKGGIDAADLEHAGEKRRELEAPGGKRGGTIGEIGILGEQPRVMQPQHAGA